MSETIEAFGVANKLRIAERPFGLHQLASDPPAGADQVKNPNEECASYLVDDQGRPAAIVFVSWGGRWMRDMADLCRWLKLPAFAPPAPRDEADRHFIVVARPGFGEPQWLPEQRR
jgi:hypothetical protein